MEGCSLSVMCEQETCSLQRPLAAVLEPEQEVALTEKRDDWLEQVLPELAVGLLIYFIGQFECTFLLLKRTEIAN